LTAFPITYFGPPHLGPVAPPPRILSHRLLKNMA
jgi:hypothetical protein